MRADLPIDETERLERELKDHLNTELVRPLSGDQIRRLAELQRDLGFLLKYKSYAVKAASPLGYSVFLQNRGEGFSFQRHLRHKTEIFYVLDVLPGGYVYISEFEDWQRIYARDSFEAWLRGAEGLPYEAFRYVPQPGDVIVIDRLNVVHTVVGCTLAEFATVSTDMVDRLHDQNEGRPVPAEFSRDFAERRIRELKAPAEAHQVVIDRMGVTRTRIPSESVPGGSRTRLGGSGRMEAAIYRYDAGASSALTHDSGRAVCLHVVEGRATMRLGTADEMQRPAPPSIPVTAGDLLLVAPGAHYAFANDGDRTLSVAEHRIPVETAFVR